jgi:hypothetical protein
MSYSFPEFFIAMSDDELRAKADEIYCDLVEAANMVPQSGWHEACFAAMHCACTEMRKRNMPPPTGESIGATIQ